MWTIFFFRSLLNLLQYSFCFMLWCFGQEAYGIFVPQPGIKLIPPAPEGEVSATHWTARKSLTHIS